MAFIEINNLSKSFGTTEVLHNIDLIVEQNHHTAILGASGSGKSTLMYLLGGLDRATSGTISVEGQDLGKMNDEQLALYRNSFIGFVFQFHFLLPSMNNLDNILLPANIGSFSQKEVETRAREMANRLGVEHCLKKFPYQISGGEQQRVNIIRALSLKPKLLLCDEPTGNLDSKNSSNVVELLQELAPEFGSTLVVVTHDHGIAERFPQKITIEDGRIIR